MKVQNAAAAECKWCHQLSKDTLSLQAKPFSSAKPLFDHARIVFKRSSRDLVKLLWISNKRQITWAFVCWSRSIELMWLVPCPTGGKKRMTKCTQKNSLMGKCPMLLVLSLDDYYITLTEILSEKGKKKKTDRFVQLRVHCSLCRSLLQEISRFCYWRVEGWQLEAKKIITQLHRFCLHFPFGWQESCRFVACPWLFLFFLVFMSTKACVKYDFIMPP